MHKPLGSRHVRPGPLRFEDSPMSHKTLLAAALAFATLFASGSAFAGPATDKVKAKQTELFSVVAQPKTPARQTKLQGIFDQMLAYDVFARESLGKKWSTLDASQQQEFGEVLTKIVRNNYRRNLKKMLDFNIVYASEKPKGGAVVVATLAKHKTDAREPDIEIDFKMKTIDGRWMVVDIVTERASLVKTYKAQFLRILRKDGYPKLISKLRKKLKKQEAS
jgi:phospholipid transport system substrate-binding protein